MKKLLQLVRLAHTSFILIRLDVFNFTGYNSGLVVLLDIGSQHEIYSFNLNSDITSFGWTQNNKESEDNCNDDSPLVGY